jgi:hypothetical protein
MRFFYQRRKSSIVGLVGLLSISTVFGCDSRPTRVHISGQVLIDGKPLTVGDVKFVPEGARPSSAKLDKEGRFTLTCYDGNDGAIPGHHRVQVSASEISGEDKVMWHAPMKYASFRTSGLTVDVNEPTDSLVIELTSDGNSATVHTNSL